MQRFAPTQRNSGGPRPPDPRRAAAMGLIVIVLLVIVGLFLIHVLRDMSKVQDCAMQGRTNCAPIR
jgi:uncharacterized membrane protein